MFLHESCVFRICSRINNFNVYAFYCNPGYDGSLYDCLLDKTWVQSVDDAVVAQQYATFVFFNAML